jgi:hypothetical protein
MLRETNMPGYLFHPTLQNVYIKHSLTNTVNTKINTITNININ